MDTNNNVNDAYKYGFDIMSEAILNKDNNYKKSLKTAFNAALEYMNADSIALYRRDSNNTDVFNRYSFVSKHSSKHLSGVSDSCIANYVSRVYHDYRPTNFDINYPNNKTRIDILPIETLDRIDNIVVIAGNKLEMPQLFNEVFQKSLETILTNMYLFEAIELARVTDSLTGIKNREGYNHRIDQIFKNGTPQKLTYTIADLFRLKSINDQFSHVAGDDYIRSCAESLHTYFRRKDGNHIYRIGGDEFVILSEKYNKETVELHIKKANTILRNKMRKYSLNHKHLDFMINYGISELSPEINTPQALYKTADEALSENKKRVYLEAGYERRGS